MAQYACIKSGKVVNVIEVLAESVSIFASKYDSMVDVTGQKVSTGMLYNGKVFSDDPDLMQQIAARQARKALLSGLSTSSSADDVRSALLALLVELNYQSGA